MRKAIGILLVVLMMTLTSITASAEEGIIHIGDYNENVIALHQKLSDLGYYELRPESPWSQSSIEALNILQFNLGEEETGEIANISQIDRILALDQVNGRNLLSDSDYYIEKDNGSTFVETKMVVVEGVDLQTLVGKTITISIYVNSPGERGTSVEDISSYMTDRFGAHGYLTWSDSTGTLENKNVYPCTDLLSQTVTGKRISSSYEVNPPEGYDTLIYAAVAVQSGARPADDNSEVWALGYPKMEIGRKATWDE